MAVSNPASLVFAGGASSETATDSTLDNIFGKSEDRLQKLLSSLSIESSSDEAAIPADSKSSQPDADAAPNGDANSLEEIDSKLSDHLRPEPSLEHEFSALDTIQKPRESGFIPATVTLDSSLCVLHFCCDINSRHCTRISRTSISTVGYQHIHVCIGLSISEAGALICCSGARGRRCARRAGQLFQAHD